jgi:1-acyl-sn-glycerol-3-phosphate acyltransferase
MYKRQSPDFYPPQLNPLLVTLAQRLVPLAAHWYYDFDLVVSQEDLDRLRSHLQQRMLLLPNHPTFDDPIVIFVLSARLGIPFYYLSARETLQEKQGAWLQRLGVYSIRRGMVDRSSVAQTLELLTQPSCKLVIFAEGGCSFQNDTVMPFRVGAIQMAFQAINKVLKQEKTLPDLYAVPISIKYRYTGNMTGAIEQTLKQLEQALEVKPIGDLYQRLRTVAFEVLLKCEREYGLVNPQVTDWNQRVANLKAHVLQQCEQQLGLTSASGELDRERTYRIQQALEEPTFASDRAWTWEFMSKAAWRVLNFDAIYDGYVAAKLTPERFLDTLIRLERDVFNIDRPRPKGHRQALLRVAEPLNLKDWFADYQQNRTNTVKTVTQKIHQQVQENLENTK